MVGGPAVARPTLIPRELASAFVEQLDVPLYTLSDFAASKSEAAAGSILRACLTFQKPDFMKSYVDLK